MIDDLSKLNKKAINLLLSHPKCTRIRVVSHYDADGITSAGIICNALYRKGYDFHVTLMRNPFTHGFERLKQEENEIIFFLDMGSGQIETIEKLGCKAIIIDHHQYHKTETSDDIVQINSNLLGIDGNYEACGATLTYLLAKTLDKKNEDLISLALAGAMGDKQYIGGIRGYNKTILDEAIKNNYLKKENSIKLYGKNIFDAIFYSIDPFYLGLSGDKEKILVLLEKLHISENTKLEDVDKKKKKQLQSLLILNLIKNGCEKNILDTVIRERYWSDKLRCELERFADLLDSCGKGGNRSLGLLICLNDKTVFEDALKLEKEYRKSILDELLKLERDGCEEKENFRYFYSNDSSRGGVICGIAVNYLFDRSKPLFALTRKDGEVHVSCRGNQYLVSNGLDLGVAMKQAAEKLGGHGGGHKIAAGATISSDKEEEFLNIVDEIVEKQMGGVKS
ncbi:MAG: DHH family phosphoesterase [Candidatus Thermoplasmatota archaeon]|jgi:RecJ-like exonuclease|nr:DHH family phosphoesterase [Candidatus Thermoplasmatota archaeon]